MKNIGTSVLSVVNPIKNVTPNSDHIIKIISIFFCAFLLFTLYKKFWMIYSVLTDSTSKWDFSIVVYFLPLFMIPTAIIFFFKHKKIGWILLAIFLTYSIAGSIELLILNLNIQPLEISELEIIVPPTSLTSLFINLVYFTGTLWIICKEKIRKVYGVEKNVMILSIGSVALLTALTTYGVFN